MKFQLPAGDYLVTGGAGYLGSLGVKGLLENQPRARIVVIDDLSKGSRQSIDTINSLKIGPEINFIRADVGRPADYEFIFKKRKILAVLHFAGFIEVGESVKKPARYLINNAVKPEKLLQTMVKHNCLNFIFSSTASVYGIPKYLPLDEKHPTRPNNPYGRSKLAFEKILCRYQKKYGLNFIAFRYFNAAGADSSGLLGENHHPETHLIPNLLLSTMAKKPVRIFGQDYPTPDGTCIRDYVHVVDLISAHLLGLDLLLKKKLRGANYLNLGTGRGYSIMEVIKTAEKVTGEKIKLKWARRRPGDVPVLVASNRLSGKVLGWGRNLKSLQEIIESAWKWHLNRG